MEPVGFMACGAASRFGGLTLLPGRVSVGLDPFVGVPPLRRLIASRLAVPLFAIALGLAASSATATAENAAPVVIPLQAYADTPLKVVQVKVGTETIPFLLDTGGGLTFVTPAVAGRLGCEPFGQATGFRADGEKVSFPRCGSVGLDIGGYRADGEVGVFDLMGMIRKQVEHARKQGHAAAMPPTLGGMIALPSFRRQAITLDYAHDRLIVETPQSMRTRVASMRPLDVRIATLPSGGVEVFVQAKARKGTLWLQLDSGNNGPTFLAPHAIEQLGISLPKDEKKSLQIELAGFGAVSAKVARRSMIYDGQLGLALISKLVITLDLENGKAWAKPVDQPSR